MRVSILLPARLSSRSVPRPSPTHACRSASPRSWRLHCMAEMVVAFDVPTGREALALAARLPGLTWAKVGPVLLLRDGGGPALVREFAARGIRVFLDLKWHDIPNTVADAVTAAPELGVAMATMHCLAAPALLDAPG